MNGAGDAEPLELTAYAVGLVEMPIVPAGGEREWMSEQMRRAPYRCLPMVIANCAGWLVLNSHTFKAVWDGGTGRASVRILYHDQDDHYPAVSHFGGGILTFEIPYLVRTPPGYNLLVRGPANLPRDGIQPLEGIVETDWTVATFTMNWKFTRPDHPVLFERGEPVCMLVPQRRRELARFTPALRHLSEAPDLKAAHEAWNESRADFQREMNRRWLTDPPSPRESWQKHYLQGVTPTGERAPEHETTLQLPEFRRSPTAPRPV